MISDFVERENMIFVTGDIHGEPRRFTKYKHVDGMRMTKNDTMIILGDFGLIWSGDKTEEYLLDWMDSLPFTTVFIDGNHENFDLLNQYPVVDYKGGKAHKIRNSIYHLMRGYVFEIDGCKFFAFGGASSHDISDGIIDPKDYKTNNSMNRKIRQMEEEGKHMYRIKGRTWWPEELPSEEEMQRGIDNLEKHKFEVDYVITHCLPSEMLSMIYPNETDIETQYFNKLLYSGLTFKYWYAGHYHINKYFGKYEILYDNIRRIK